MPWLVRVEIAIKKAGKFFCQLLFPDDIKCIFCGQDVPNFEEQPFCEECKAVLPFNNGHKCAVCDQPIEFEAKLCSFCKDRQKNFEKAFCPFIYEGKIKNSIFAFKESNRRFLAKGFAQLIVKYMSADMPKLDIVTYIPMAKKKQKKRGFNQSQLLAEEIGKLLNLPVLCLFSKQKDSKAQKNLNYKERTHNVMGMFALKKAKLKESDNILIVDDIITSGATIGYCAGLLRPKVGKVYVCALAREIKRDKKNKKNILKRIFRFKKHK